MTRRAQIILALLLCVCKVACGGEWALVHLRSHEVRALADDRFDRRSYGRAYNRADWWRWVKVQGIEAGLLEQLKASPKGVLPHPYIRWTNTVYLVGDVAHTNRRVETVKVLRLNPQAVTANGVSYGTANFCIRSKPFAAAVEP